MSICALIYVSCVLCASITLKAIPGNNYEGLAGEILLGIFNLCTIIIIVTACVKFVYLKRTHTINFNAWTLINVFIFNISFIAGQITMLIFQNEVRAVYDERS